MVGHNVRSDVIGDERAQPPLLRAETRIRVLHDDVTIDRYSWLRDKEDPEVLAYLEAENCYADQATAHLANLKAELIVEIEGRQCLEDNEPSLHVGPYVYFQRREGEKPHSSWWRRPVAGGPEQLVFDPNAIPGSEIFYTLGVFEPSDDGRYVAYSFNLKGDERYELRVRDVGKGGDVWCDTGRAGRVVWAADNHTLLFTRERADRRQHDQAVRLDLRTGKSEVIFEEVNLRLDLQVRRSNSGDWLFLDVLTTSDMSSRIQRVAAEVWCISAVEPAGAWRRIVSRDCAYEVYAEHWGDNFLFRVNDAGPNWRLVRTPMVDTSPSCWEEVVSHREGVILEEIYIYDQHLILLEREGLRPRLTSRDSSGGVTVTITPDEPACTIKVGQSAGGSYSSERHSYQSSTLTYSVSSFLTPDITYSHDLLHDRSSVLSRAHVPGYDATEYVSTIVMAKAEDGVQIPISLVMRRDRAAPGPVLLNVYGSYGISRWQSFLTWPSAMTIRLSLLDRGFAFGIVHVRGGGELGRPWHDSAVCDRKHVTHSDLIAAAEGLIKQGIANHNGIVIEGKSAGGGTVLAAAAAKPDLFRAVVAEVPLTDIVDTQLDFTLPYALKETAEYGDAHVRADYRQQRKYDPYYNLSADHRQPPTYVDSALHDGQVLFFQPARYVAQRRYCSLDRDPKLVFRTRFVGSHGGPSHGPAIAEQAAFRLAWILSQVSG